MKTIKVWVTALTVATLGSAIAPLPSLATDTKTIKFAVLAPPGSSWTVELNKLNTRLKARTNGRLKLKIYPGGVMGDETDVIRKLRQGQLQGAALTGMGLGEIAPEARLLEIPFYYQNYAEFDRAQAKIGPRIAKSMEKAGFVSLGSAEVGFVYLFTDRPIHRQQDLKGVKMWMWAGDPLAEQTFKELHITPKPLGITDVMTSLQTNMINGVYNSPMALLALQWNTQVKYMLDLKLTMSTGGLVVTKKAYSQLSPDLQKILKEETAKTTHAMVQRGRVENDAAIDTLRHSGIKITSIAHPSDRNGFVAAADRASNKLVNRLFPAGMLKEVRALVK